MWELLRTASAEQLTTVLNRMKVRPEQILNLGKPIRDMRQTYELLIWTEDTPKKKQRKKVNKDEER